MKSGKRHSNGLGHRTLRLESLEQRQLLTGDVACMHNFFDPEDVNGDGTVAPLDALKVINYLNRGLHEKLGDLHEKLGEFKDFLDVNGDGTVSPLDALNVINRMNRGGEHGSAIPAANRIEQLVGTIADCRLPKHVDLGGAADILESLLHGEKPELDGQIVDRIAQIRHAMKDGLPGLPELPQRPDLAEHLGGLLDGIEPFDFPKPDAIHDSLAKIRNAIGDGTLPGLPKLPHIPNMPNIPHLPNLPGKIDLPDLAEVLDPIHIGQLPGHMDHLLGMLAEGEAPIEGDIAIELTEHINGIENGFDHADGSIADYVMAKIADIRERIADLRENFAEMLESFKHGEFGGGQIIGGIQQGVEQRVGQIRAAAKTGNPIAILDSIFGNFGNFGQFM